MSKAADQERFLGLLEEQRGILYKVAASYGRTAMDRRDLAQEIVMQLWRSFDRYDDRRGFPAWMYRIALNVAISFNRSEERHYRKAAPAGESLLEIADPRALAQSDDELRALRRFLDELVDLDRVLVMLDMDGYTHEAIAEIIGLTPRRVGAKIGRIKDRSRRGPGPAPRGGEAVTDPDDLKRQWSAQERGLDAGLRLNARLLRGVTQGWAESALGRLLRLLLAELAILAGVGVWLASFLVDRLLEPRFLAPAAVLEAGVVLLVLGLARQILTIERVDYAEPIVAIQKRLASLRVTRVRVLMAALLAGPLAWIPILIVALRGLFDVDAYRVFSGAGLVTNVIFGLLLVPLAIRFSRSQAARMESWPFAQRLLRVLAGYNLNAASGFVADLERFETDEPGA